MNSYLRASRREAERLFERLHRNRYVDNVPADVIFPRNFSEGNCKIVVVIPVRNLPNGLMGKVARAHSHYSTPPAIINKRRGRELRLVYRFKGIKPNETKRVSDYAGMIAEWVRETFRLQTTVKSVHGMISLRWTLWLSLRGEAL